MRTGRGCCYRRGADEVGARPEEGWGLRAPPPDTGDHGLGASGNGKGAGELTGSLWGVS